MYSNTNFNSKNTIVNSNVPIKPSVKRIKVIENRQLVPPSHPQVSDTEWAHVEKRNKHKPALVANRETIGSRQRPVGNRDTKAKSSKRFIKPAVVTITNKSGGATYAEILAKARERVTLKDLQTTTIRRAMNGAIVIEVTGPPRKTASRNAQSQPCGGPRRRSQSKQPGDYG